MRREFRFTGVGGQGVLTAGEILAAAAINAGQKAAKASTYSSQVRGGPTKVDILLDKNEILFPYAISGQIEFMLSTAQMSYEMYKKDVKPCGIIVVDSLLVNPSEEDKTKYKIFEIPIIKIAKKEVGHVLTQSVVALGITVEMTQAIEHEIVFETMKKEVPAKTLEANIKAYELGIKYAKEAIKNKPKHLCS